MQTLESLGGAQNYAGKNNAVSGSMRAEVIYHSMRTEGCRHESHPVV